MESIDWGGVLRWLLIVSGVSLALALLLGIWVWQRVKRLRLPPDATFVEAMRLTPFSVVLFLDLLDLGLDFSLPLFPGSCSAAWGSNSCAGPRCSRPSSPAPNCSPP